MLLLLAGLYILMKVCLSDSEDGHAFDQHFVLGEPIHLAMSLLFLKMVVKRNA